MGGSNAVDVRRSHRTWRQHHCSTVHEGLGDTVQGRAAWRHGAGPERAARGNAAVSPCSCYTLAKINETVRLSSFMLLSLTAGPLSLRFLWGIDRVRIRATFCLLLHDPLSEPALFWSNGNSGGAKVLLALAHANTLRGPRLQSSGARTLDAPVSPRQLYTDHPTQAP